MAKAKEDKFTSDLFGNRPGRPRKVDAMTVAERVRKHRAKAKELKLQGQTQGINVTSNENSGGNLA